MKTVTMLEFRRDAENILLQASAGAETILTYRGKPLVRINPIEHSRISAADPFYRIGKLAEQTREIGKALTNEEMDRLIYGT